VTAVGGVEAVSSAEITTASSATSSGEISVVGASEGAITSSVTASAAITAAGQTQTEALLTFTANARKKWEDDAEPSDTWTDATDDDIVTWTDAPVRVAA
jgi:hypothetical protein